MTSHIRAATLALACSAVLSAQQPASPTATNQDLPAITFLVEVNYVEVDAFVTDAQGNPITDLKADDFELLEDGQPQTVSSFLMVNLPIVRADQPLFARAPIEPDVRANQGGDGRIYMILLDDLHVHPTRAPKVRTALRQFIERSFGTEDLGAVISARGGASYSQDFTNNPRLLINAVERFTGRMPLSDPVGQVVLGDGQQAPLDPAQRDEAHRARTLMATVERLAEFMGGVRGRRKTLILVSEGIGFDIFGVIGEGAGVATSVTESTQKAVAAATRSNVSIYPIDPRGLSDDVKLSDDVAVSGNSFRLSQDSLRVLAADTGGFAAVNQTDLGPAFDRIVRENSAYYLLGYHSTNGQRNGKYRRVQVRVTRPGLQVRSRHGYAAPRADSTPTPAPRPADNIAKAASTALASPLPVRGVPMKVFAAAYKGTKKHAVVVLATEFDPTPFDFVEKNGTFNEQIDQVYRVTDPTGKVLPPVRHELKLSLKPETYEHAKANGLRVLSQMELAPGRYQLRSAVGNSGGKAGSVLYDLEIPDFGTSPLEMSGVAVTSARVSRVTTVRQAEPLRRFLPGPVTTTREFGSDDIVAIFGEVYENLRGAPTHTVDITTELREEGGTVVQTSTEQRSSTELKGAGDGFGFGSQHRLNGLRPGLYVIRIHAQANTGARPTVTRQIQFRVR